MRKKFGIYLAFLIESFYFPKALLAFQFGLISAWFANDRLTSLFFSDAVSGKSVLAKFGIVLMVACIFSIGFYVVISLMERIYPSIENKIERFSAKYQAPFQGKVFFAVKTLCGKKWFKALLMMCLSLLASFYIFGANLEAQWWIIDDHEIMAFLGDEGGLDLKEIPAKLMADTEVGGIGGKPRYRPSYYFLRLLETALWGNHPNYFYLTRLIICAFFIFVCWNIAKDFIGIIGGCIFTMAVMSFNYWAEIYSRLGPAETYAVLGFSLFCFGFFGYAQKKQSNHAFFFWVCIFLGAVISMGSKENMVLLAAPIIWMLVDSIIRKRLFLPQLVFSTASLLYCAFIVYAVILGISNRGGHDIYATDVSGSSLFTIFINEFRTLPYSIIKYFSLTSLMIAISYACIVFGLTAAAVINKNTGMRVKVTVKNVLLRCALYLGCIYLLFLSQQVFYAKGWPTGLRYDFPGKLGEMAALIVLMDACLRLFNALHTRRLIRLFFQLGYCVLFFIIIQQNNFYFDLQEYARTNAQRSCLFTKHIKQIKEEVSVHPDFPIIFESFDVFDYEPVFSTKYFFEAYGIQNPIMVHVNGYTIQDFNENSLEKSLAFKLEQTSENGGWVRFSPYERAADLNGNCYNLDFSGVSDSDCVTLGKIW